MIKADTPKHELLERLRIWQEPLIDLLRDYPVAVIARAFDVSKQSAQHALDETDDRRLACQLRVAQFYAKEFRSLAHWRSAYVRKADRTSLTDYIRRQDVTVYADRLLKSEIAQLEKLLDAR